MQSQGLSNPLRQSPRGGFVELDAVRSIQVLIQINYRVIKPAGATHNGYRAVVKAVHLIQAARLKPRGHEKKIATRFNPMRERMIVSDSHCDFARITSRKVLKCLLQRRRTAAQQYKLKVRRKHFGKGSEQKIAAFLVHQPADVAEQGNFPGRKQSKFPLQRQFDRFLAPKIAGGESLRQKRISL